MGTSEKFCLRWNDFETNISTAFRELRDEHDFFDVTLVCNDDQIQAHKVILSASSPFFKTILRKNLHKHPLIYMKGIKYVDIVSVLNFIYHGEVNVAQEELNSFLSVAEELKVKGLTQDSKPTRSSKLRDFPPENIKPGKTNGNNTLSERNLSKSGESASKVRARQQNLEENVGDYVVEEDIQEVTPIKTEPTSSNVTQENVVQNIDTNYGEQLPETSGVVADPTVMYVDEYSDYPNYEDSYNPEDMSQPGYHDGGGDKELDAMVEQMMSKTVNAGQTVFACNVCQKIMKKKRHMMCHVETHIEGMSHICLICNKSFKTRNSLDKHKHTYHKNTFSEDHISVNNVDFEGFPQL